MHNVNAGYTLLARLKPGRVEAVSAILAELSAHPERLPFGTTTTTHFASITVIPEQEQRGEVLPATLLFATSYCGPLRIHLRQLVLRLGMGLRDVLKHCADFDPSWSDDEIEDFLYKHQHDSTFYSGMKNLSPEDVRQHRQLRDAIEDFIDEQQRGGGMRGTATRTREEIQDFVRSRPDLAWALRPHTPPPEAWFVFHRRSLRVLGIAAALLLASVVCCLVDSRPLAVAVTLAWIAVGGLILFLAVLAGSVCIADRTREYVSGRQPDARVRAMAATQFRPVINEFTIAGPVKDSGFLRPLYVRIALWVVARLAEGVPGLPKFHSGINIPTVATARWIAADRGRRLIFISNYTNEGIAYVRDFIEPPSGAARINLTFGFGRGYPQIKWLALGGAIDDPNAYLNALRENQRPTLFWYGPYRDMSIDNIKLNRKIREGLFGDKTEDEAKKWLQLL